MSFLDLLWMSWLNLRRRKLRTFLTVLGVIIGTSSIVVMISLGIGMQNSMYAEMEEYGGATLIKVFSSENDEYGYSDEDEEDSSSTKDKDVIYVTDDTIKSMREMEYVSSVEPVYTLQAIIMKGKYTADTELVAMNPSGLQTKKIELAEGNLPEEDSAELQLVFGNQIITNFYSSTGGDSYWETGELPDVDLMHDSMFLILDTDAYYSQGGGDFGTYGFGDGLDDEDGGGSKKPAKKHVVKGCGLGAGTLEDYNASSYSVYCDLKTLLKALKKEYSGRTMPGQADAKKNRNLPFQYSYAELRVDKTGHVSDVSKALKEAGYNIETNAEELDSVKRQMSIIEAVLGGIGAISLLVAAIGIANTMMMSIYERTKEIGVMKVLGCSLANIQQMFLMEAAFIGFIGGVVGNVLSFLISLAVNRIVSGLGLISGDYNISSIPVWLVLISMGFAVFVGVLAGYFPSKRAMQLSPLEAIRNS